MKALNILKEIDNISVFNDEFQIRINEAIKELEDLQNRSCENCKYCSFVIDSSIRCDFFECYQQKSLKFCGNWESKC